MRKQIKLAKKTIYIAPESGDTTTMEPIRGHYNVM